MALLARHPELGLAAVAVLGWVVLGERSLSAVTQNSPSHHANVMADGTVMAMQPSARSGMSMSWWHSSTAWLAMLAATMIPALLPNARYLSFRCTRRRRQWTLVEFLIGWLIPWALVGLLSAVLLARSATFVSSPVVALFTFCGAAAWQATATKRRSLIACHRVLAPPLSGLAASEATLRYGIKLGRSCVVSCWLLMACMTVTDHNFVVLAAFAALQHAERRGRPYEPIADKTVPVILMVGAVVVAARLSLMG